MVQAGDRFWPWRWCKRPNYGKSGAVQQTQVRRSKTTEISAIQSEELWTMEGKKWVPWSVLQRNELWAIQNCGWAQGWMLDAMDLSPSIRPSSLRHPGVWQERQLRLALCAGHSPVYTTWGLPLHPGSIRDRRDEKERLWDLAPTAKSFSPNGLPGSQMCAQLYEIWILC